MKLFLFPFLLLFPLCLSAQRGEFMLLKERKCNIGIRIGFNASLPIVHTLAIDGKELDSFSQRYRVGYLAAVSLRLGENRFFFNPSISWHRAESELQFALPQNFVMDDDKVNEAALVNHIHVKTSSIEVPLLIGYDLIKENPYRLSVMIGPKIKYRYKTNYDINIVEAAYSYFTEENHPYNLNLVTGINVTIGRLFLDFNYEFGITHTSSSFLYVLSDLDSPSSLEYKWRTNTISFALGILF